MKMGFWDIFKREPAKQPEDYYTVIISSTSVKVEHPKQPAEEIHWNNIRLIKLINTNAGPVLPDVWLTLIGDQEKCFIPQGAKGYDEVYDIVSKYKGFDFENVIKSMTCADNAEFILWEKGKADSL
jgi:hypothetical protein